MKKWLVFLAAALLLAGCMTNQPAQPASLPTATPARPPVSQPQSSEREPGCTVVSKQPTPTAASSALIAPVSERDWIRGAKSPSVTIIDYSDFQCPGCAFIAPVLERLAEKYPDDLQVVYRHFPLTSIHDKAAISAQAAEAAGRQDSFWEMHDRLFARRDEWVGMTQEQFSGWLAQQVEELGLDAAQFTKDLNDPAIARQIQSAWETNAAFMPGTPYLLINGEAYNGQLSYADLDATIALMKLTGRQFEECPPLTIDPTRQYLAVIETEKGKITLELYADKAPLAVNNFVFLARQGWYDGVTFHRVLPGFMAQTGDPTGTGFGGPGYAFDNEISDLRFDGPGVLGMANAGPGSNGSQFFITYAPAPHLDGGYTIFGQVIEGIDVLGQITPRDPSKTPDAPPGDRILTITIVEK